MAYNHRTSSEILHAKFQLPRSNGVDVYWSHTTVQTLTGVANINGDSAVDCFRLDKLRMSRTDLSK